MSDKPSSAAQARDAAEHAAAADALAAAFGDVADLGAPAEEPAPSEASTSGPAGPPGGPPGGPPSRPSGGPPRGPPGRGPPRGPPAAQEQNVTEEAGAEAEPAPAADAPASTEEATVEVTDPAEPAPAETEAAVDVPPVEDEAEEPEALLEDAHTTDAVDEPASEAPTIEGVVDEPVAPATEPTPAPSAPAEETPSTRGPPPLAVDAEVRRLRGALSTAQATIEALDEPQVPPAVLDDIVVPQHVVADIARMGRWMVSEDLARGVMGGMAMLHPDHAGVVVATRMLSSLPRLDERSIVVGRLGAGAPRGARDDWRLMEVLLASVSVATGGPAAVLHAHGPYTTAMSCEKDLVVQQPLDELGKKHIGRIIIVDRDPEDPESFLRMAVEALQQGGMRCIVVRGHGAYAVGADLTQAWANASMVEHSMRVALLARQAGLKT